ncbi:MAG: CoA-binding protein [Pseudomonadota bacterium]
MTHRLQRFLSPKSVALFGSAWATNVAEQLRKFDYQGEVFPVHPTRDEIGGFACFKTVDALPKVPDAAFVGVNRHATLEIVSSLAQAGAGGAVCFASGFKESDHDDAEDIQESLIAAAGDMPILGPNCYGFINYLDNTPLWPDQMAVDWLPQAWASLPSPQI